MSTKERFIPLLIPLGFLLALLLFLWYDSVALKKDLKEWRERHLSPPTEMRHMDKVEE